MHSAVTDRHFIHEAPTEQLVEKMDDAGDPRQDLKIRSVFLSGNYAQVKSDPVYGRLLRWRAPGYAVDSQLQYRQGLALLATLMPRVRRAGGAAGGTQWDAAYRVLQRFARSHPENSQEI
jgi:hypothetical protein